MTSAILLINPQSRSGGEADLEEGLARLRAADLEVEIIETESAEHSRALIRERHAETDLFIIAGGDGTISATAAALYETRQPFAILPLGTANDLARSLEIPSDISAAFSTILEGRLRDIDLGRVNGHYFFNACHLGLGVEITHELSDADKKSLGVLSYLKAFLTAVSRRKEFRAVIETGDETYKLRSMHISVGNGKFYGGGNLINEDADNSDGRLDLCSIRPQTVREMLYLAPLMRFGKQYRAEKTLCLSGERFRIKTSRPKEIDADGEFACKTPAEFTVIKHALKVMVPQESPAS